MYVFFWLSFGILMGGIGLRMLGGMVIRFFCAGLGGDGCWLAGRISNVSVGVCFGDETRCVRAEEWDDDLS